MNPYLPADRQDIGEEEEDFEQYLQEDRREMDKEDQASYDEYLKQFYDLYSD